jgi:UDP-N-acetylmuramate--alanine ligase
MSALARILVQRGDAVQGSDLASSALLMALRADGVRVEIGHDAGFIHLGLAAVVYSSDVKESNVELRRAKELGLPLLHRSDLLHRLMEGKKTRLITGTHGKTTTTSLLTSVLVHSGRDPSFVIGGILRSVGVNGRAGKGEEFVAEADESDGSFLKTAADVGIVTNLEREHLNYWQTEERLTEAFRQFCEKSRSLFWCADDPALVALRPHGTSYGFSPSADVRISNYRNGIVFDLSVAGALYRDIELPLWGRHNALNGSAVFACALSLGVAEVQIRAAFRAFGGVGRRMEKVREASGITFYDDYGHHPTEIATTLAGLRAEIGKRRLVVLFQPHRYSRVQDISFQGCFTEADQLIVTDIYSAGETPIPGLSGQKLAGELRGQYSPRDQLDREVELLARPGDVLITVGAGDITRVGRK